MSYILVIPLSCETDEGVRKFMTRATWALSMCSVLSDDAIEKVFAVRVSRRLEDELEILTPL